MNDSKTYHLKQLHIQNFACFKDVKLENIKRINMVFGKNGTGKTWLLRAVDLLANYVHSTETDQKNQEYFDLCLASILNTVENFDVKGSKIIKIEEALRKLWRAGGKNLKIDDGAGNTIMEKKFSFTHRQTDLFGNTKVFFEDECFKRIRALLPSSDLFHVLYVGGEEAWKSRTQNLSEMTVAREKRLLEVIQSFSPEVKDIRPHATNGLNIYLKNREDQDDNPLPLGYFGYGFKRLVLMYFFCMINERNILGIDEFENGLHFDKQKQVAESLLNASKQFDTQLFVTSHSQECSVRFLNAVEEAGQADDFSCFYLDRDEEGEIVARQRDFESAKFILENWKDDEDHRFV